MSILSTLAAPGSAVVVTSILGWVAHRLGTLKIGNATLSADVAKGWPAIVAVVEAIPKIEAELAAQSANLAGTTATAEAANLAAGSLPSAVSEEVQAQFARLFPQLMTATPAVTPPAS